MVISCGDDNNVTPSNNSGNSPAVVNSVPVQDTTPVGTGPSEALATSGRR